MPSAGQIAHDGALDAAHRRQRHQRLGDSRRDEAEQAGVDAHGHGRGVRRPGEDVQHVTDTMRIRIGDVEGLAVLSLDMGDVIDGGDDEIDRHDIRAAALKADGRHQAGSVFAQLLDEFEK